MEKAIIFGAGITGMTAARELKKQYEVLCFWDNNPRYREPTWKGSRCRLRK